MHICDNFIRKEKISFQGVGTEQNQQGELGAGTVLSGLHHFCATRNSIERETSSAGFLTNTHHYILDRH